MNYNLNYEGFEKYLVGRKFDVRGVLYRFKFENGFGASVIKGPGTYGGTQDLWELGVVRFDDEWDDRGYLCYETKITSDVIGYKSDEEIRELLGRIKALKDPYKNT